MSTWRSREIKPKDERWKHIYKPKHGGSKRSRSEEPQDFEGPRRRSRQEGTWEFLEKIQKHVTISWGFGKDIGHLLKHVEDPTIPEPTEMTVAEEAVKWNVRLWSQEVDRYGGRRAALEENKGALYAVLMDGVSNIVKSKLKSKTKYSKADEVLQH